MRYALRTTFGITAVVALMILSVLPAEAVDNAGNVIAARRQAWAERGARQADLAGKSPVFTGDTLVTNPVGRLQVLFLDDSVLMMAPDSRTTVTEYVYGGKRKNAINLNVARGVTRLISGRITEADPSAMSVDTRDVHVGIQGTEAQIAVSGESTVVSLLRATPGKPLVIRDKRTGKIYRLTESGTSATFRYNSQEPPELRDLLRSERTVVPFLGLALTPSPLLERRQPTLPGRTPLVVDTASGTGILVAEVKTPPINGDNPPPPVDPPPVDPPPVDPPPVDPPPVDPPPVDPPPVDPPPVDPPPVDPPPVDPPGPPTPPQVSFSGTYIGNLTGVIGDAAASGNFSIGISDLTRTPIINQVDVNVSADNGNFFQVRGEGNLAPLTDGSFAFDATNAHGPEVPPVGIVESFPMQSDDSIRFTGNTDGSNMNLNWQGQLGGFTETHGSGSGPNMGNVPPVN